MSNEDWYVQTNFKIGDDLYNIRGIDVEHLIRNATELAAVVGQLAQTKANLKGGGSLSEIVKPVTVTQPPPFAAPEVPAQPTYAAPVQAAAPTGSIGPSCDMCGAGLEHKSTQTGKPVMRCPNWRWNSAQRTDNGHTNQWL